MKKSIAVLLALILMMTAVFFGCGKKEDSEEVNKDETSQQAPSGEGSTQSNASAEGNSDVADTTEATETTASADVTDVSDTTGATEPTDITNATPPSTSDPAPSKPDNNSQQTVAPQGSFKLDKYKQLFASGTYSMTITTVTDGVDDVPVDFACKNGNIRMSMEMEGFPAIMIYRADNDTAYVLLEILGKFYTELTEELMGEEIDFSQATKGFTVADDAVITSGTGTFGGKTVTAETVVGDGKTSVFYFDANGTLLGTEVTEGGKVSVTKISNISTNVDDSLFDIPEEYKYMDLSWLMNMA